MHAPNGPSSFTSDALSARVVKELTLRTRARRGRHRVRSHRFVHPAPPTNYSTDESILSTVRTPRCNVKCRCRRSIHANCLDFIGLLSGKTNLAFAEWDLPGDGTTFLDLLVGYGPTTPTRPFLIQIVAGHDILGGSKDGQFFADRSGNSRQATSHGPTASSNAHFLHYPRLQSTASFVLRGFSEVELIAPKTIGEYHLSVCFTIQRGPSA
jgi:hypothetical protein